MYTALHDQKVNAGARPQEKRTVAEEDLPIALRPTISQLRYAAAALLLAMVLLFTSGALFVMALS